MALNFDPTKKIKPPTSSVKIFEEPVRSSVPEVVEFKTTPEPEKPTNNLLKTPEEPTKVIYEKDTKNLRITTEDRKPTNEKPTDTPTKNLRTNLLKTTEKPTNLSELVGIQRATFLSLVKLAKDFGFLDNSGNRITPPINGNEFAQTFVNKTYKQTKDTLYHLKIRGFIKVYSMKNGRGGNVQYLIEKGIYQSCLNKSW